MLGDREQSPSGGGGWQLRAAGIKPGAQSVGEGLLSPVSKVAEYKKAPICYYSRYLGCTVFDSRRLRFESRWAYFTGRITA